MFYFPAQRFFPPVLLSAVSAMAAPGTLAADQSEIQEILVTADFRRAPEMAFAASLSIVGNEQIRDRAAQHLEEILNVAPNVNYSAGASRGRYLQIRGIGERSQFVDPINPSVGLTIDGVDLSGVGNASTLYDVEQVEVLRGPQGTRFGASALAGMVNITSKVPTEEPEGRVDFGLANYDTWQAGGVISGPISDKVLGRIAVQQYKSDGFIDNAYLDRDDTNSRDELTARARLRWLPSDDLTLDYSLFYIDVDNGYDAFSLDNNRTTLSDEPGTDAQETLALSLTSNWTAPENFDLVTIASVENTDVVYGYDEDWTNTEICEGLACDSDLWGFNWWYSSTDTYFRDRDSKQLDVRLVSTEAGRLGSADWVLGVYYQDKREDLRRDFFDFDLDRPAIFDSRYDTERLAVYGELGIPLTDRLTLNLGGRVEDFTADYDDSRGVEAEPDENLWGGEITLEYQYDDNTLLYGLVSRGFKAGGVNGEALGKAEQNNFDQSVIDFLAGRLVFETETANNLELGLKGSYLDDRWTVRLAAFYMERNDVQLRGWYNEGPLFVGYVDNGASGTNEGLELETAWQPVDNLTLFANVGVLETEIEDFFVLDGDTLVDKTGRDQAHAPGYQYNVGADLGFGDGFSARVELDGKDSFYFSDSHDRQSGSYTLVHANLRYETGNVAVKFWGRNLTDRDYAVRGFYFPNDPREFYEDDHAYIQLGAPRTFGVTGTYRF